MMPCLKPLMLEAAMGLSALVQEQNVVTWAQADNVNSYIRRLQQAVQRLTALNQQLTMCHEKIQEKVCNIYTYFPIFHPCFNESEQVICIYKLLLHALDFETIRH
jgi:hypothetical protein